MTKKPTVLIVGYGLNESFAGPAGLPAFLADYGKLLDALAPLKARLVILSPPFHEDLGRPYPDPTAHDRDLVLYVDALHQFAAKREAAFVDLYHPLAVAKAKSPTRMLTSNGILLNADGYWLVAAEIERQLGLGDIPMSLDVAAPAKTFTPQGRRRLAIPGVVSNAADAGTSATDEVTLVVRDLPQGRYVVKIAGKPVVAASEVDFAKGVKVPAAASRRRGRDAPQRRSWSATICSIAAGGRSTIIRGTGASWRGTSPTSPRHE